MEEHNLTSSTRITLLIGTTKGAFLISDGSDRSGWTVRGPYCEGWPINHVIGDPETGTIWAGGGGEWHGAGVWRSDDGGESWKVTRLTKGTMDDWAANDPNFAKMIGWTDEPLPFTDTFAQIWSLSYAHGTLYAGTKPANLLASENGGKDWKRIQALTDHPSAASWNPGAAGLVLHTIVSDPGNPKKLWVGISAAGVFATEDGGATWERRNRLSNAERMRSPRPPCRAARRRNRALRPQHDACAGHERRDVPAEPSWCMAHGRWRPKLGRPDQRPALDLRFSDPSPSARSETPSGRCRSTATWQDVFHPTQPRPSGALATAAKAGRRCAKVCRRRAASSRCCVKRWRVTNAIRRVSISAQTVARSSRASMKVRIGRKSHVTCQQYWLLKCSNGDNVNAKTSHQVSRGPRDRRAVQSLRQARQHDLRFRPAAVRRGILRASCATRAPTSSRSRRSPTSRSSSRCGSSWIT